MAKNKELYVKCSCGRENIVTWTSFLGFKGHWKANQKCPSCRKKMVQAVDKLNDGKNVDVVMCPHCKKLMLKSDDQMMVCLNCKEELYKVGDQMSITCSECGAINWMPEGKKLEKCLICDKTLDSSDKTVHVPKAPVVVQLWDARQMEGQGYIVRRHLATSFSSRSQLIVSEGTYAVVMHNGVARLPYGPGMYLLQESDRTYGERLKSPAEGESLSTTIYCVKSQLPQMTVGSSETMVVNNLEYNIGFSGFVTLNVFDANYFLKQFGYREMQNDELTAKETLDDGQFSSAADQYKNKAGGVRKEMWNAVKYAYDTAIQKLANEDKEAVLNIQSKKVWLEEELQKNLNYYLSKFGLSIASLVIENFVVRKPLGSKRNEAEELRRSTRREYEKDRSWSNSSSPITVYQDGNRRKDAKLTYKATYRLQIIDESALINLTLAPNRSATASVTDTESTKTLIDAPDIQPVVGPDSVAISMIENLAGSCLHTAVQELLDNEKVPIPDLIKHTLSLSGDVARRMNEALTGQFFKVAYFALNTLEITYSDTYKAIRDAEERQENLLSQVEQFIEWEIDQVSIHVSQHPELRTEARFKGTCQLRVQKPETFFATSEAKKWLSAPSVNISDVKDYYTKRIQTECYSRIAAAVQDMIDDTEVDIRELSRRGIDLAKYIRSYLDDSVAPWGMTVESLNLARITTDYDSQKNDPTDPLNKYYAHAARVETSRIDRAERTLEDENRIFNMQQDAQLETTRSDIELERNKHLNENRREELKSNDAREEAETDYDINKLNRDDRLAEARHRHDLKGDDRDTERQIHIRQNRGRTDTVISDENRSTAQRSWEEKQDNQRRTWAEAYEQKHHDSEMTRLDQENLQAETERALLNQQKLEDIKDRHDWRREDDQDRHAWDRETRKVGHEQQLENKTVAHDHDIERSKYEHAAVIKDICQRAQLDEGQFRYNMNEILRKIAESKQSWQEKLDAYARMQRNLGFDDADAQKRANADTAAYVTRAGAQAQNDVDTLNTDSFTRNEAAKTQAFTGWEKARNDAALASGLTGVKLSDEQARVSEAITRFAEDRLERTKAADHARAEETSKRIYTQTMAQQAAEMQYTVQQLKMAYDNAAAIRNMQSHEAEMKAEIEKLRLQLQSQKEQVSLQMGADVAKRQFETAEKIAAAKYEYQHRAEERAAADAREAQAARERQDMTEIMAQLFSQVTKMEESLSHHKLNNDASYDEGRTQVDLEYAKGENQRAVADSATASAIKDLKNYMESMSNNQGNNGFDIQTLISLLPLVSNLFGDKDTKSTSDSNTSPKADEAQKQMEQILRKLNSLSGQLSSLNRDVKVNNNKPCPKCHRSIPVNALACVYCGHSFTAPAAPAPFVPASFRQCKACGIANQDDANYCKGCGMRL